MTVVIRNMKYVVFGVCVTVALFVVTISFYIYYMSFSPLLENVTKPTDSDNWIKYPNFGNMKIVETDSYLFAGADTGLHIIDKGAVAK